MERFASLFGIFALLGIGYLWSEHRKSIRWRIVWVGIALQVYLALFIVRAAWVPGILTAAAGFCAAVLVAAQVGALPRMLVGACTGLGLLGWVTTFLHHAITASAWTFLRPISWGWLAVALGAFFVPLRARRGLGLAGNVAIILCVWLWDLPHAFVFHIVDGVGRAVTWLVGFAALGADSVFGGLRDAGGFVFAIEVGSIILLFGGLMSFFYYVGVIPWLVGILARVLHRALGVSGAESLAAASNVFVGQTEAPLVIRPYLAKMTRSEIMALMAGGFATIAGSVLGAYVAMFQRAGFARGPADLIAASVMSAPAAFVFAKLMVPETELSVTADGGASMPRDAVGTNVLDALAGGVTAGLKLAVNVVAMLLVFYALIHILDASVNWFAATFFGRPDINFSLIYSCLFAPFAFLMGVPWGECVLVGQFLGTKTIFNEFIAYDQLTSAIADGRISTRGAILSTYALCGFANFMSIGIQIGGLSQLAPTKRPVFSGLALRAMVAGALACQLTACIVGVLGRF